jgi:predicted SAM-dependent methyltransferase
VGVEQSVPDGHFRTGHYKTVAFIIGPSLPDFHTGQDVHNRRSMRGPFQQDIPWRTTVTGNVNESEGQSGLRLPLFSPAGIQSKLGPA